MSDEEMDIDVEKKAARGGLLRQKAENTYSQEEYFRRLKEDKKKRMDYLMSNSELGSLLKGEEQEQKKVPESPEKRRRAGKAGEIDEAEIEEAERRLGSKKFHSLENFRVPSNSSFRAIKRGQTFRCL